MEENKLYIWLEADDKLRIQFKGDPIVMTKMLRTAMDARRDIAAAFIAAVIHFANGEGVKCGDLQKMVVVPGMKL